MSTKIPSWIDVLQITKKDYQAIARNLKRVSNLTNSQRREIIERANHEFPQTQKFAKAVDELDKFLFYDRDAYSLARIPYSCGLTQQITHTAIADYLLRQKPELKIN